MDYTLPYREFSAQEPHPQPADFVVWNVRRVHRYIRTGNACDAGVFAREAVHWAKQHRTDSDCTVDEDTLCCTVCGVEHDEDGCADCGGRGFHKPHCETMLRVKR